MAKRAFAFHPSAIALAGISSTLDDHRSKKAFVENHLKETSSYSSFEEISTREKTPKVIKASKPLPIGDSFELVDGKGTLLPPKIESSLEHLTKSRPRSPGRRNPTTSARRKSRELNIQNSELHVYDYALGVETAYGIPPGSKQTDTKLNFEDNRQRERENTIIGVINYTSRTPVNLAITGDLAQSSSNSTVVKPVLMSALQTNASTALFTSTSDKNSRPQNRLSSSSRSQQGLEGFTVNAMYSNGELMKTKSTLALNGGNYGLNNESDSNSDSDDVPPPPPPIPPPLALDDEETPGDIVINQSSGPTHKPSDTRPKVSNKENKEISKSRSNDITGKINTGHSLSDRSRVVQKELHTQSGDLNRTSGSAQSDTPDSRLASYSKPTSSAVLTKPSIWQAKGPTGHSTSDRRRRFKPVAIPSASEITEENESLSKTLPETKSLTNSSSDKLTSTFPGITTGVSLYDSWLLSRNSKESGRHPTADVGAPGNTQATPVSTKSDFEKARDVFSNNNESTKMSKQQGLVPSGRKATSLKASNPENNESIGTNLMLSSNVDMVDNADQEMEYLDQPAARVHSLLTRNLSLERARTPSPEPPVVIEYDAAADRVDTSKNTDSSSVVHHSSDEYMKPSEDTKWPGEYFEAQMRSPSSQFDNHLSSDLLEPGVVIEYDDGSDSDDLSENLEVDETEEPLCQPTTNFPSIGNKKLHVKEMGPRESSPHLSVDSNSEVLQPPPMFTSDEESDYPGNDTTPDESDAEEELLPPAPPPPQVPQQMDDTRQQLLESLLQQQKPKELKAFHKIQLEQWSESDAAEWLDYIGLGHFKQQFKSHHVDGKTLMNVNFPLLEEIGIKTEEERELILSEIYELAHFDEESVLESEIQDALETATDQDKEKIVAVLNALRSPVVNPGIEFVMPSTSSSSPRDSDGGYPVSSDTASLASSATAGEEHSQEGAHIEEPIMAQTWSQPQSHSAPRALGSISSLEKLKMKASRKHETKKDKRQHSKEKKKKIDKDSKKEKKSRGFHKLLDSLNLTSGTAKLTKLFGSKKMNPNMQYLLQAGPRAILRVWPKAVASDMNYCSLLVSMTTTCAEVIKMVIDKYGLEDDSRTYYLKEVPQGRGFSHVLERNDCPLLRQCQWPDPDKYRLEFRQKDKGEVNMVFEFGNHQEDSHAFHSIVTTSSTPCVEVVQMAVRKFDLPGEPKEYFLVEISEENEDDRRVVADHVCPLKLQEAWAKPDHVFRLCHMTSIADTDWPVNENLEEEILQEKPSSSNASSVRGANDSDTEDFDEQNEKPFSQNLDESQQLADIISGYYVYNEPPLGYEDSEELQVLAPPEGYITDEEPKSWDASLLVDNEKEVELIRHQNKQIIEKEEEIKRLRTESLLYHEKESELDRLREEKEELLKKQKELEESLQSEISVRDKEIERLYLRNNELMVAEKELEKMNKNCEEFTESEEEIGRLKLQNAQFAKRQTELEKDLDDTQEYSQNLESKLKEVIELKRENEDLLGKTIEAIVAKEKLNDELEVEREKHEKIVEDLEVRNRELEKTSKSTEVYEQELQSMKEKSKEVEYLKDNIIKLTAKLREADNLRHTYEEMDSERRELVKRLDILQARNAELEKSCRDFDKLRNENSELSEKTRDMDQLKRTLLKVSADLSKSESEIIENRDLRRGKNELAEKLEVLEKRNRELERKCNELENVKQENASLTERANEMDRLRKDMGKWIGQLGELDELKRKQKEHKGMEASLNKQLRTMEGTVAQRDRSVKEYEMKIRMMTEVMKDTQARLEEQEQNKVYLDKILAIIKDRDPVLLQAITSSLASSEPEEWC